MMHFKVNYQKNCKISLRNILLVVKKKLTKIFQEFLSVKNGHISLLKNKQIFLQEKNAIFVPIYAGNPKNKKYLAKEIGE